MSESFVFDDRMYLIKNVFHEHLDEFSIYETISRAWRCLLLPSDCWWQGHASRRQQCFTLTLPKGNSGETFHILQADVVKRERVESKLPSWHIQNKIESFPIAAVQREGLVLAFSIFAINILL